MSFSNVLNNRKRAILIGTVGFVSALGLVGGGLASLTAIDRQEGHEVRAGVDHGVQHVTSDLIDVDVSPGADLSRNYSIQGQNTGTEAGHVAFHIEDGTAVAEEYPDAILDRTQVYLYFFVMGTDGLSKQVAGHGTTVTFRELLTSGFMYFPENPETILQPGETVEVGVTFVPAEEASQWEASAVGEFAAQFTSVFTLSAVDPNGRSDLAAEFLDKGQLAEGGDVYMLPESDVLDASGTEAQRIEATVSVTDPAE